MARQMFKPLGLILIIGLVVAGICLFTVFGGGLGNLLGGGRDLAGSRDEEVGELGQLYTAVDVDRNGCPVEEVSEFFPDESVFAGLEESEIPRGTELFMRLYYEGQPVEDAPAIEADSDIQSCVWFEFQPSDQEGFAPGEYEAELVVNGNPVDSISFEVDGTAANSGSRPLPNTGGDDVQLGQAYASSEVDQYGCPLNDVSDFDQDEPVFVSVSESYVPAGTEVFARLIYEGEVIEDTQPIVTDQDLESCIWFEFEAGQFSGGFEPGNYEADIYVNGELADTVQFFVR